MKKFFNFSLPLQNGTLMTTVRLTVGGLAAEAGLDVDEGEDFKVCITESLLIFKRNGFGKASVRFEFLDNYVSASLSAEDWDKNKVENNLEDEISYALLGALVDEVSFTHSGAEGVVNGITLIKKPV